MTNINEAIYGLGTTIETISQKVQAGKDRAKKYREDIVSRLSQVVEQLTKLKNDPKLKSIPQLQGQLLNSNAALQDNTNKLNQTTRQLEESQVRLAELKAQLDGLTAELQKKETENSQLKSNSAEQFSAIQQLRTQKEETERNFAAAQQEVGSLVQKINSLNTALTKQISLIDTIAQELGDGTDVNTGFQAIADNLGIIMNMINTPDRNAQPTNANASSQTQLFDKFMMLTPEQRQEILNTLSPQQQTEIDSLLTRAPTDFKTRIDAILKNSYTGNLLRGGRRKTRGHSKRKQRKTLKKWKGTGGYIYSESKALDDASSVVSNTNTDTNADTNTDSLDTETIDSKGRVSKKKRKTTTTK